MTIARRKVRMKRADVEGKEGRRKRCHLPSLVEDDLKRHDNRRGRNKHERELTHIFEIEWMIDLLYSLAMDG